MSKIRWLGVLICIIVSVTLAVTTTIFRFRHPTLTETQLTIECGIEYVLMGAGALVAAILMSPRKEDKSEIK